MPLLLDKNKEDNTRLAVWRVEESNQFFLNALNLTELEHAAYLRMKSHRQREWLSSRYLLDQISGDPDRSMILKSPEGKPSRQSCERHISISHSKEYTAVIISDKNVGIDIQRKEAKIIKVAHKFISESEKKRIPKKNYRAYCHVFWGAKESMYKSYGLKELEFREHMHLYPFKMNHSPMYLKGWVRKPGVSQEYNIYVERVEDTFLVYCLLT